MQAVGPEQTECPVGSGAHRSDKASLPSLGRLLGEGPNNNQRSGRRQDSRSVPEGEARPEGEGLPDGQRRRSVLVRPKVYIFPKCEPREQTEQLDCVVARLTVVKVQTQYGRVKSTAHLTGDKARSR